MARFHCSSGDRRMAERPSTLAGDDAGLFGERPRPGAAGPLYDWLLQRGVALWFLGLATTLGIGLAATASKLDLTHPGTIAWAAVGDMLSRLFTLLFFALAAWLSLVRAPAVAKARGLQPRLTALLSVTLVFALPLLPRLPAPPTWLLFLSAGLALLGNALALAVLNRLGTSFSVMSEARRLVTDGPYRFVRHPLYLTEEIAIVGIFLPYWSWAAGLLFVVHLAVQLARLRNEERVLRETFPDYADYARRTACLIPGIW
jgi:protein-S-isoprenylcysteine O-methyltransferase Ste14